MAAARNRSRQMTPGELVAEAARLALEDAKGDQREAAAMLERAANLDRRLYSALMDPWLSQACADVVRRQIQATRQQVWTGSKSRTAGRSKPEAVVQQQEQRARVVSLAAGTLAMFPLPGGKALGQATREDIAAAADFYARQSADMGAKARWLRLIGQSLPEGKTVSEVLSDKRLRELQAEAQREQ